MTRKVPLTVPTVVIAEWWRGRTGAREHVLSGVNVEAPSDAVARLAGEALSRVRSATVVDPSVRVLSV